MHWPRSMGHRAPFLRRYQRESRRGSICCQPRRLLDDIASFRSAVRSPRLFNVARPGWRRSLRPSRAPRGGRAPCLDSAPLDWPNGRASAPAPSHRRNLSGRGSAAAAAGPCRCRAGRPHVAALLRRPAERERCHPRPARSRAPPRRCWCPISPACSRRIALTRSSPRPFSRRTAVVSPGQRADVLATPRDLCLVARWVPRNSAARARRARLAVRARRRMGEAAARRSRCDTSPGGLMRLRERRRMPRIDPIARECWPARGARRVASCPARPSQLRPPRAGASSLLLAPRNRAPSTTSTMVGLRSKRCLLRPGAPAARRDALPRRRLPRLRSRPRHRRARRRARSAGAAARPRRAGHAARQRRRRRARSGRGERGPVAGRLRPADPRRRPRVADRRGHRSLLGTGYLTASSTRCRRRGGCVRRRHPPAARLTTGAPIAWCSSPRIVSTSDAFARAFSRPSPRRRRRDARVTRPLPISTCAPVLVAHSVSWQAVERAAAGRRPGRPPSTSS